MDITLCQNKKPRLKCPNEECNHIWIYHGKSRFYASCPFCRRNVHVIKNKICSPHNDTEFTGPTISTLREDVTCVK